MIYTENTNKALKFMFEKHKDQCDKSGVPYVFHPFMVANSMDDEDSTIVALLHDVLEDTDTSVEEIRNFGFSENVIEALMYLTHDKNVDYMDYIRNILNNDIAVKVKISDIIHNSDRSRLNNLTEKDTLRYEKYKKALAILENRGYNE